MDIDAEKIKRVYTTKYLGMWIDDMLNWKHHVQYISKSLLKYFGIFNHIKHIVTRPVARQLYFAFIYSRVSYGIEVYGSCSQTLLATLQILQNKLLKLVLRLDYRTATNVLHRDLHLLKVCDIQKVKILCFVNNCLLKNCPDIFNGYYTERETEYNLRNRGLNVPRTRTINGSLSVYVHGAKLWNGIPESIKQHRHQLNFKKYLIKYFTDRYI